MIKNQHAPLRNGGLMGRNHGFTPRHFTPREKLSFFRLRDKSLAGDSSKDRRFGRDTQAVKNWLFGHKGKLGDCVELEKAHDQYREGLVRMALRKIFGR